MIGYVVRGTCTCSGKHAQSWGGFEANDLSAAIDAAAHMASDGDVVDVRIFAVSDDGTETPLPTYEEALAGLTELRAKAATLRETADACEDARSLYDAIKDFCAEVSK